MVRVISELVPLPVTLLSLLFLEVEFAIFHRVWLKTSQTIESISIKKTEEKLVKALCGIGI
jgi:hypothetical protein